LGGVGPVGTGSGCWLVAVDRVELVVELVVGLGGVDCLLGRTVIAITTAATTTATTMPITAPVLLRDG